MLVSQESQNRLLGFEIRRGSVLTVLGSVFTRRRCRNKRVRGRSPQEPGASGCSGLTTRCYETTTSSDRRPALRPLRPPTDARQRDVRGSYRPRCGGWSRGIVAAPADAADAADEDRPGAARHLLSAICCLVLPSRPLVNARFQVWISSVHSAARTLNTSNTSLKAHKTATETFLLGIELMKRL